MSRDEQERLRDVKDAIVAIRRHLDQAGPMKIEPDGRR